MKVYVQVGRDKHDGYVASCPSLPGCMCRGNTSEEAISKLIEAVRGYLAAMSNIVPESIDVEQSIQDAPPTQVA